MGNLFHTYVQVVEGEDIFPAEKTAFDVDRSGEISYGYVPGFRLIFFAIFYMLMAISIIGMVRAIRRKEYGFVDHIIGICIGGVVWLISMIFLIPPLSFFLDMIFGGTEEGTWNVYYLLFSPSGLILTIITISIMIILMYGRTTRSTSKMVDGIEKDTDTAKAEFSSTLDRIIENLHLGKDVRSSVLKCYLQMCRILERRGVKQDDFMTPREFKRLAVNRLHIDDSHISDLTKLFEEARYSVHKLGEDDRKRAIRDLTTLRREIVG